MAEQIERCKRYINEYKKTRERTMRRVYAGRLQKINIKLYQDGQSGFDLNQFAKQLIECPDDAAFRDSAFADKDAFKRVHDFFMAGPRHNRNNRDNINYTRAWDVTFKDAGGNPQVPVDRGGPSKQINSSFFRQLPGLEVAVTKNKSVRMFTQEGAHNGELVLWPKTDESIRSEVRSIILTEIGGERGEPVSKRLRTTTRPFEPRTGDVGLDGLVNLVMTKVRRYARLMGTFLLHAVFCNYLIPTSTMPRLILNFLFRGVLPGDDGYIQEDYLNDMRGLAINNSDNAVLQTVNEHICGKAAEDIKKWFVETFIYPRSEIMCGLVEGFSLNMANDVRKEMLYKGGDLQMLFHQFPADVLYKVLFEVSNITYEDVERFLLPVYINVDEEAGKVFYNEQFLPSFRAASQEDRLFLSKFLLLCTGTSGLPFVDKEVGPASRDKIKLEFNTNTDGRVDKNIPEIWTCSNQVLMPYDIMSNPSRVDQFVRIVRDCDMSFNTA